MPHGGRKPSLENKFPGSNAPAPQHWDLSKGLSGSEVPGSLGARAGLEPSGAFPPLLGLGSLWRSQSPCSRVGPGRGFPAAGAGAAAEKVSHAERRNTMQKRANCAVIFKTPVSYCRFVSVVERPVFPQGRHTRGGVPGLRRCGGGRPGASSSPSFIQRAVRVHVPDGCQPLRWAWGVVWNPVLAPTELTEQCGRWPVNRAVTGYSRRVQGRQPSTLSQGRLP